ncbi:5-formyltetrahydrofolate cyclo-ligase [Thiofilum flexile]|uniref:5-formyltetrahydrofolate cyclo-ligase n=1 Tax=Thiofilum flexile TaxID=125627 RepID=UPI00035F2059|nr:5-formyltetrahydrofolate cyclo-ligase [Thiofilum flexile]
MTPDLKPLRTQLKRRRAALSFWQRQQHARRLAQYLNHHPYLRSAQAIGIYWPVRGEADPRLIRHYLKPYQKIYLPVLAQRPIATLQWIPWTPHTRFNNNRFNIPEPLQGHYRSLFAAQLDCVLVPLLGFGTQGQRLGMGGGFYDRSFALLNRRPRPLKPHLIGIGYEFQRVPGLNSAPWDVALNSLVTERGIRYFR